MSQAHKRIIQSARERPQLWSGPCVRHDVLCGDAREVLKDIPTASCDALVTDPPAGVSFMNLAFDSDRGGRDQWVAWLAGILAECRRVMKPGSYALVWALPRTSHWTGMALEEAGFALRDQISHLFGSGFPKSQSCLKPAHEVWWLAKAPGPLQPLQIDACRVPTAEIGSPRAYEPRQDREQWRITGGSNGSGATSPAGRWPSNLVLSHHPGCRPAGVRRVRGHKHSGKTGNGRDGQVYGRGIAFTGDTVCYADADGTEQMQSWSCVDGCPIKALDEQAGPRSSGAMKAGTPRANTCGYRGAMPDRTLHDTYGDMGSVSRFFPTFAADGDGAPEPEDDVPFRYCAKASRSERNAGLDSVPVDGPRPLGQAQWTGQTNGSGEKMGPSAPQANGHPTVKPIALMQWLVRLVTPPGGLVLDPFAGSGSTGAACVREGLHYLLIDQDEQYCEIAQRRVAHEQEQQTGPLFAGVSVASK